MNVVRQLFGTDNSPSFINNLPNITLKGFTLRVIASIVFIFIILILGYSGILLLTGALNINEEAQLILLAPLLYLTLIFISIKFFYASSSQLKQQFTSLKLKEVIKHVFIISLPFYLIYFLISLFYYVSNPQAVQDTITGFDELINAEPIFNVPLDTILFSTVWILTGIGEELFFRGGIYRALRKNFSLLTALLMSSFLFVIPHAPYNISSISIFVIAIIYGFYFEYKNNILTIVILHTLHDLFGAGLLAYLSAHVAQWLINI